MPSGTNSSDDPNHDTALNTFESRSQRTNADQEGRISESHYFINHNANYEMHAYSDEDLVNSRYKIEVDKPLPSLDSHFAKAYEVKDISDDGGESSDSLYALILSRAYPIRLAEINKLMSENISGFTNILSAGVLPISSQKGRNYCVILQRPKGITLGQYIKEEGKLSEHFVENQLVPALDRAIQVFQEKSVVHGRINVDNIYLDKGAHITLGEGISEPCGFSQPQIYERLGRAFCLPIAKGVGDNNTDYYALGVTTVIALTGYDPSILLSHEELLEARLDRGTYRVLVKEHEFSVRIFDLLRGTLNDKVVQIWSANHLEQWIGGRRFNLLPPANVSEAGRPLTFMDKRYQDRRQLAHALHQNWEEAKAFCKEDTIIRWVERSIQDVDLANRMAVAANVLTGTRTGDFTRDDELLVQYILFLDPRGPLRVKDIAVNFEGVGLLLAQGFDKNIGEYINFFKNMIEHNLASLWGDLKFANQTQGSFEQEAFFAVQKCVSYLKRNELGFDLERCLFELNQTLPCQSSIIQEQCPFSVVDVLLFLGKIDTLSAEIIDKNIAAFLAAKTELPRPIRIPSLMQFPDISNHIPIQTLAMLSHAQQSTEAPPFPNLCKKIMDSLGHVVDTFQNTKIRDELTEALQKASKMGNLVNMLAAVSDTKYLVKDRVGFSRAAKKYKQNAIKILRLGNRKIITNVGYRYGLQLSVIFSFLIAASVFIILMMKYF